MLIKREENVCLKPRLHNTRNASVSQPVVASTSMNLWEYRQLGVWSSQSLAQRLLCHEHWGGSHHVLVLRRKLWWSSPLPHPQHSAQLLRVQPGSPRVRSKIKSIGIHLLLQLGSQSSLRKLLTGFNMWAFSLLWLCSWLLQRYSCPVLPVL